MLFAAGNRVWKILLVCVLALCSTGCTVPGDPVIESLGEYERREFFTHGEFQDYTDYGKYYYTAASVTENRFFKKVGQEELTAIQQHLNDYEEWIVTIRETDASAELVLHYDFDRAIIDPEDYVCIESESHGWSDGYTIPVNYNVYLFDSQTQVLYYFHNNI